MGRGGLETTITEFDPRAPMRDAIALFGDHDPAIALEVVEPEQVPPMRSDRRKISKILRALLANAFKFTHEGKVRLALRTTAVRAVYTVEDTGIGIPKDAQQYVFDEFRQVDGTMTRRYGGSGLGLTLARRLAHVLGGEIIVSSTVGVGSTFGVDLPLDLDASTPPPASSGFAEGGAPKAELKSTTP
jgi:signal transduction histidine kinase